MDFCAQVLAGPFARANRWGVAEGGRAVAIFLWLEPEIPELRIVI